MFAQKATAFVMRRPKKAPQLLAFQPVGKPNSPWQLPGGSVYIGESVKNAAIRELWEESGLKDLLFIKKLGTASYYKPRIKKTIERHCFMFKGAKSLPDAWEHKVKGNGGDKGQVLRYRWLNPEEALLISREFHSFLTPTALPIFFSPSKLVGLKHNSISLMPHTFLWQELFDVERRAFHKLGHKQILDIQHIGSTAIPSIPAKPIVDIAISVKNFEKAKALVPLFESLGYTFKGENEIPGRHYFVKNIGGARTHHLHVFEQNNPNLAMHLLFRDTLRKNPELAQEYARLKLRLWRTCLDNRHAYQEGKKAYFGPFFEKMKLGEKGSLR